MATVARRTPPRGASAARESSGYSGSEVDRRMAEEEQKQKARKEAAQMSFGMPFRFFCLPNGETKEVIIVDDRPNFVRHEHALENTRTGKYDVFTACIAEHANCPVCKVAKREAYFAMYLTCIDLTPYTNKDGIEVPWSKKLIVVKTMQQKKFTRLMQQHGTLRGMVLAMTRDGDKEAAIGSDIQFVEFLDEDTLATYVADYEYEKDGKKQIKEIIGYEPFNYDELFPMPTEQQLRAVVGGRPEPGSREDDGDYGDRRPRRGGDDWEGAPRAATRQAARPAARPPARTAPTRTREIDPDDLPDAGGEAEYEEEAAPPPRRVAPRVASRATPREEAPAEEEYEEEAAPPPRRAAPPQRAAAPAPRAPAARAPVGRAAPSRAAQPDPEEPEPPQRSAGSLALRRQALRR